MQLLHSKILLDQGDVEEGDDDDHSTE